MEPSSGFHPASSTFLSKRPPVLLPSDPSLSLPSFLLHSLPASAYPSTSYVDAASGFSLSYLDLHRRIRSVAAGLYTFGVRHGDVLLILSPNSLHSPVLMLAAMLAGAVITLANPLNTPSELSKQIADSRAKFVATTASLLHKFPACALSLVLLPEESQNISTSLPSSWPSRCALFAELLHSDPTLLPQIPTRQQDTAALLYSSGTTGASKGVIITHRNLIAQTCIIFSLEGGKLLPDCVFLCLIPIFHVYGLGVFVSGLLALGSKIVIMAKFDMQEMLTNIQRYKVTNLPLVPPILLALTKMSIVDQYDLSSLKQIGCGAAPLSKELVTACRARFPQVTIKQGYGLTESTSIAANSISEEEFEHYDSPGLLAPNTEAKIVDVDSGNFLPPNKQGELWLRGPTIMQGYFGNPGATDATIDSEGWLHTGDLCYFDDNGYLYVVDRLKELIKYKGLQVAPAELEGILLSHPDIVDAAVIPLPDAEAGQVPMAYIVRNPRSTLSEPDVMKFISEQVAPYKKIRRVAFVTEIPKSSSGKVLRRELINKIESRL